MVDKSMQVFPAIRSLNMTDWSQVIDIEQSVDNPWDEHEFRRCFYSKSSRQIRTIVAEYQGRIVGYSIFRLHNGRISMLRLATLSAFRRRGVGSAMFKHISGKLSNVRPILTIETDEENLPMQLFLKSIGAKAVGINRKNGNYCFKFTQDFYKIKIN